MGALGLLSDWMLTHGISQVELGQLLGGDRRRPFSQSYVSQIVSGSRPPHVWLRMAIERVTGGAVPASSWLEAEAVKAP